MLDGEPPAINDPVKILTYPGKKHDYSNFGYLIIQKLLEDVSGKPFPDIMKETVLEPLEMTNSTFTYPSEELLKRIAVPHDKKGEARESGLHPTALAQGGLLTTPIDLGKYVVELMNAYRGRPSRVLSPSMVRKMLTPEVKLNPREFMGFTGQGPGMFLVERENNVFFTHPGANELGATCNVIGCAETGQGAAVMTNGINGSLLSLEALFSVTKEYNWSLWEKLV